MSTLIGLAFNRLQKLPTPVKPCASVTCNVCDPATAHSTAMPTEENRSSVTAIPKLELIKKR